jgi:hypothetical protein
MGINQKSAERLGLAGLHTEEARASYMTDIEMRTGQFFAPIHKAARRNDQALQE